MNIILVGPPGAGKGTQAKRLHAMLGVPHIASGDLFRDIRRQDTPLALQVREFMDRGEYVPDELTIELVLDRLSQQDASRGFVLDGFPRTKAQAVALDGAMSEGGKRIDAVINISAPSDILTRRLATRIICPQCHEIYNMETRPPKRDYVCDVCGHSLERRTDEGPDVVKRRLETYILQTQPVVEYYGSQSILLNVDGARPPDEVQRDIDRRLVQKPSGGKIVKEPA